GLLRQPGEMRMSLRLQGNVEYRGGAFGAVNLFRRRACQGEARAFAGHDIDVEAIAACNSACGVDEHRRQALTFRRGKAHAQRPRFMQGAAPGDAVGLVHVKTHRAAGTVGGENRRIRICRIGPHSPASPQKPHATEIDYSAICRLISPGSRLFRSQANFTAPLSITAKLSPSSQAKSRYCSTRTMAMLPRLRR